MSIQHGNLGIVRDGLVHYYDMQSLKSFPGEGGYNLLNNNSARCESGAAAYWGGATITSNVDFEGKTCFKTTTLQDGFLFGGFYRATGIVIGTTHPFRLLPTGSYSFSCKIWAPAGRILSYGFRYYPQGEESSFIITGSNSWQTIKRENLTLTTSSHLSIQIRGLADDGTSQTANTGVIPSFTFYVAEPMVNSGSYAIPYFRPDTYSILTTQVTGTDSQLSSLNTTFTKGTPGDSWTNARISSSMGFSQSAHLLFRAGQTDKFFMMALNNDPNTGINWTNLDYAIYCKNDGTFEIRESSSGAIGLTGSATTAYTTASVFEIKYNGSNITYWKDNNIVRTVPRTIGNPLYMDSSFYSNSTIVNGVLFNNGRSNFTGSGGFTDISKISNVNSNINLLEFDSTGPKVTVTGSYVWFGGSNIYLKDVTNDGNSHTLEMWCMTLGTHPGASVGYLFGRRGFHSGFFQSGSTIGTTLWYSDNTAVTIGSTYAGTHGVWRHFTMTVNESTNEAKFYVNGVQNGSTTTLTKALRTYTSDYHLYGASTTDYVGNCRIGTARIYKKTLSETDILQNYNAQKHLYGY